MIPANTDVTVECGPINEVLARIGDKWTVLVVGLLAEGPRRFNELRRLTGGISQRMLTLTLRGLERDGLVTRSVQPTVPPRVDYALTALGRTLIEPVTAIANWARKHRPAMEAARRRYDERMDPASAGAAREGHVGFGGGAGSPAAVLAAKPDRASQPRSAVQSGPKMAVTLACHTQQVSGQTPCGHWSPAEKSRLATHCPTR